MRPQALSVQDDCLNGWEDKDEILNNESRWTPPIATTMISNECDNVKAGLVTQRLLPVDLWAASMNKQWFKSCSGLHEFLISKNMDGVVSIAFSIGAERPVPGDSCLVLNRLVSFS